MWEFEHKISYNSAYVTDMAKNLAPNGVFRVALFNSLIGIKKPTLVAMITKISEFSHKISHDRLT